MRALHSKHKKSKQFPKKTFFQQGKTQIPWSQYETVWIGNLFVFCTRLEKRVSPKAKNLPQPDDENIELGIKNTTFLAKKPLSLDYTNRNVEKKPKTKLNTDFEWMKPGDGWRRGSRIRREREREEVSGDTNNNNSESSPARRRRLGEGGGWWRREEGGEAGAFWEKWGYFRNMVSFAIRYSRICP